MSATRPRRLGLALACALALMSSACVVSPLVVADGPGAAGVLGRPGAANQGLNPVIQMLTANPMATSDKDAKITFTVVANAAGPMQYNWSATKGVLSSTTGQIVYWSPTKADGSLESPGDAQISVIITTANGGAVTGTAMVRVLADGTAKVVSTGGAAATKPEPSAKPAEKPSEKPSAAPTADATACNVEKVEPKAAAPSDKITIHGSGFAGDVKVMIGDLEAAIVQVNDATIVATVPEKATAAEAAQALVVKVCGKDLKVEGGLVVEEDLADDAATDAAATDADDAATDAADPAATDAAATDADDAATDAAATPTT